MTALGHQSLNFPQTSMATFHGKSEFLLVNANLNLAQEENLDRSNAYFLLRLFQLPSLETTYEAQIV